ncbi:MAG: NifB/NifX family molybdenum-iron cluster-binding protein [Deltaproteobacteria bacterium]|nr:NifB/NifX family molybdenum-iron cluster-binding protein [Deltaproteobacteria bacterium]
MRVAVPTNNPGGLQGVRSAHFGHCDLFTIVNCGNDHEKEVEILANVAHGKGGCLEPVKLLQQAGVEAIVVAGMGARPMQALSDAGIVVYYADNLTVPDVQTVIDKLANNRLPAMRPTQVCQGSGTCQH